MRYEDVRTWDDFTEYAKSTSPEARAEMEKLDRLVEAITFTMNGLKEMGMGLDIYDLDEEEAIPATACKEAQATMKYEDVRTWADYEQYMREKSPEAKAEMEKLDRLVEVITFAMDGLKEMEMGLDIYDLNEEEAIPATA